MFLVPLRATRCCGAALGLLLIGSPSPAQNAAATHSRRLRSIEVSGLQRFAPEQFIAASGLHVGESIEEAELTASVSRLGQTGAFAEVRYTYKIEGSAIDVRFQVQEAGKLHRCAFDNFVWFSDQELQEALRKRLPLYDGLAPEDGGFALQIGQVLEQILREHGIAAGVETTRSGALGDPNWVHLFVATGPKMAIRGLRFPGAAQISEAELASKAEPLLGRDYSRTACQEFGRLTLLLLYRERGHLQARLAEPSAEMAEGSAFKGPLEITVVYRIEEGPVFRWTGAEWQGHQALTRETLDRQLGMQQGEIANATKIQAGLQAVADAYGKQGYMDVRLVSRELFDLSARTVLYRVEVTEGAQYHMGKVTVSGVPEAVAARAQQAWKLPPGTVYDSSYLQEFVKNELSNLLARSGMVATRFRTRIKANPEDKTVDVFINVE